MSQCENQLELLVSKAQTGDPTALAELVETHLAIARSTVKRMTNDHELACDVAQDACEIILKALPGLREPRTFPAWFRTIVLRCLYRRRRRNRRDVEVSRYLSHVPRGWVLPGTISPISRGVGELPRHFISAWTAHRLQGVRLKPLASRQGVSLATLKRRITAVDSTIRAAAEAC